MIVIDICSNIKIIFFILIWVIVWVVIVVFSKKIENFNSLFLVNFVLIVRIGCLKKVFFNKIFNKIVIVVLFNCGR